MTTRTRSMSRSHPRFTRLFDPTSPLAFATPRRVESGRAFRSEKPPAGTLVLRPLPTTAAPAGEDR
jgi:hypothetical protein